MQLPLEQGAASPEEAPAFGIKSDQLPCSEATEAWGQEEETAGRDEERAGSSNRAAQPVLGRGAVAQQSKGVDWDPTLVGARGG